jgi:hypothetical protein
MKAVSGLFARALSCALALTLMGIPEMVSAQQAATPDQQQSQPTNGPASTAQQPAAIDTQENTAPAQQRQAQPSELPNSPGTTRSTQTRSTEKPLGTAAAEIGIASGTTASKPAGVAIAPAKQHQSRSLFIKLGALIGAGVALGTVMALSSGSPSRPPGATTSGSTR